MRLVSALVVAATAVGAACGARAEAPQFIKFAGVVTAKEAFADTYGQLMVDEMHKALFKGAQPSCLADHGIGRADLLRDRGEELLVRFGQAISDRTMDVVDAAAADREFLRLAGPSALTELRTLLRDPIVVELQRISRVGDRDRMVDRTMETFDRYVLLHRIKIDRVSPLVTGSAFLMEKNRAVDSDEKADEFIRKTTSPSLKRFLELLDAAGEALESAIDRSRLAAIGPTQLMAGLDQALGTLCIRD
jgi:hypothetical protein